jgi:hypothetical protein
MKKYIKEGHSMRRQTMSFPLPALAFSCAALLTACGGGGGGASGSRAQSVDFPYPGARYLATAPAPLVATTSSGLPVTFASNTPANCTVTDGKLVPVAVGECSVTASQAGDGTYAPASAQQLFKVLKHLQTITFASPGFQPLASTPAPLVASSDSGLPVSLTSLTPAVCTVSGTRLTLVSKGECDIGASQAGDGTYDVAKPVVVAFDVGDAPPPVLPALSGFASLSATTDGGVFDTFAGSSIDGWWCSDANWCGASLSADGGSVSYHYLVQTADPKHPYGGGGIGAYFGLEFLTPGVGSISSTGDTTGGVQVGKQKVLKFNVGQNSEWFGSGANNVKVTLVLGHFAKKASNNNSACNVALNTTFAPKSAAVTAYEVQLASFTGIGESCDLTVDPATELGKYPIVKIKIEAASTNVTVLSKSASSPTYPTELTLTAPVTVQ